MRTIVQVVSLADAVTVKYKIDPETSKPGPGPKKLRRMIVGEPDPEDEDPDVDPDVKTVSTQLVALVEDGRQRFLEPVIPDGDQLLPVGDVDGIEVVSVTF